MKQLAIRLSWQTAPAKSLVMFELRSVARGVGTNGVGIISFQNQRGQHHFFPRRETDGAFFVGFGWRHKLADGVDDLGNGLMRLLIRHQ